MKRLRLALILTGTIAAPEGPGLGFEPDMEVVERFRVSG